MDEEDIREVETNSYGLQKRFVECLHKKDGAVPEIQEKDAIYYTVQLRDVFYVGEKVRLNGQELRVSRVESHLRGNGIYHNYALKAENGFRVPRAYNAKVIGVSLKGTILEPMNNVVKVSVSEDESQEVCQTRCFRSSSVSAAMELADTVSEPANSIFPHDAVWVAYAIIKNKIFARCRKI